MMSLSKKMVLPKPVGFATAMKKKKIEFSCYQILCGCFCLLPLPITQITYAYMNDPIFCPDNAFPFSINQWLYIEASATLVLFSNWVIMKWMSTGSPKSYVFNLLVLTYSLGLIFQFSWTIVGCIQFWRDCADIEPQSVNILMYVTLILGLFRSVGNSSSTTSESCM
jgi:hypothetical protein